MEQPELECRAQRNDMGERDSAANYRSSIIAERDYKKFKNT